MMKHLFCCGSLLICLAAASLAQNTAGDAVPPPDAAPSPVAAPAAPAQTAAPAQNAVVAPATTVVPEAPPKRKSGKSSDASAAPAPAKGAPAPYVIGSLDVLSIRVWNNANLTQLYDVRPDGVISMPLIGEVKADGLTVEALTQVLTTKLKDYLTDPDVNIQVAKINSKRYYILGEGAARSGAFPLVEPITVMEALSNAGGFRDFANTKKIYILRGSQKFNFNYKEVSQGKHLEQDIQIQNGDKIFIP
jgi:polysaccharide export outer membrane protein